MRVFKLNLIFQFSFYNGLITSEQDILSTEPTGDIVFGLF